MKDYKEYYIQGSDHYLIPSDVFEELLDRIDKTIEYIEKCNKEEGLTMYTDTWQHLYPILEILKGEE